MIEVVEQPARSRFHAPVLSLLAELVPHGFAELAVFRDGLRGAITGDGYTRPVASAAVRGLAAFGPAAAEAVPDLVTAYRTFTGYPRGDLREEALATFGAIGGPALAHVRDALGESVWSLRLAAVNAIDASGDDSAETLAALRAAQADAAQRVRSRVATVLRKLENPKRKRG